MNTFLRLGKSWQSSKDQVVFQLQNIQKEAFFKKAFLVLRGIPPAHLFTILAVDQFSSGLL